MAPPLGELDAKRPERARPLPNNTQAQRYDATPKESSYRCASILASAGPCGLGQRSLCPTSQSLRDSHSPSGTNVPPPPAGGVFPSRGASGEEVGLYDMPRPLLQGEVAMRSIDGEVVPRSRASRPQGTAVSVMQNFTQFLQTVSICQGLPLWESWQSRQALTERAPQRKIQEAQNPAAPGSLPVRRGLCVKIQSSSSLLFYSWLWYSLR